MTLAIVKVLPLPVTPWRISRAAPCSKPRQTASMASGWSPMGAKGADRRKPAGPETRSFSNRVSTLLHADALGEEDLILAAAQGDGELGAVDGAQEDGLPALGGAEEVDILPDEATVGQRGVAGL